MMELQMFQLLRYVIFVAAIGLVWYYYDKKNIKGVIITTIVGSGLLLFSPVNFGGGNNMSQVSHRAQSEIVLPERVESERVSYEELMEAKRAQLKLEREEIQNEID